MDFFHHLNIQNLAAWYNTDTDTRNAPDIIFKTLINNSEIIFTLNNLYFGIFQYHKSSNMAAKCIRNNT